MSNKQVFSNNSRTFKTLSHGTNMPPSVDSISLSTDPQGFLNIRSSASQFDQPVTTVRTPIFELKSIYGISELRDVTTVTDSATITNNGTEYVLTTSTSNNSTATLDSAERGKYVAGTAGEVGIAVRLPTNPTSTQEARWGYFDDGNGAFFGRDSTGIFIEIRRAGVQVTKVYQDSWNTDPLDGTGASGLSLDTSYGNIYQIIYTWYGYGTIEFRIVRANEYNFQEVIVVHRYRPTVTTSFSDPNLPIRAQVLNGSSSSTQIALYVAGRQYSIHSPYVPNRRVTCEYRLNVSSISTTFTPMISFRRKLDFPTAGRANSVSVKLEGVDITSSGDLVWQIIFNPSTLSTTSWGAISGIPASETCLEKDISATTVSGGIAVYTGLAANGMFSKSIVSVEGLNLDFNQYNPVTLAVRSVTGTVSASAVFRVEEEW
jgi:hypothetical protein